VKPKRTTQTIVTRGADLSKARPPRWAWRNRIVLGSLNLLLGNEGVGKGTLIAWMIGQLTQGELPGSLRDRPCGVGIIGDEDGFDSVWTPRLHAAEADLDLVHLIERRDGGYVDPRNDRRALTQAVRDNRIRVLFLDQLLDNLGTGVDDWRAKQVRDALQPLRSLARDLDVAIVGSLHPNKRGDSFRQLVSGSSAFNAVSRSSLLLAVHPNDESKRVLVRGKGNLSVTPPALTFSVKSYKFTHDGKTFRVPRACDFTSSALTVDDLIAASIPHTRPVETKQGDARALIAQFLPKDGEWHPSKEIYTACVDSGIDERTVRRAVESLGLERRKTRTRPASVDWRWPRPDSDDSRVAGVQSVRSVHSKHSRSNKRPDRLDRPDSGKPSNGGVRSTKAAKGTPNSRPRVDKRGRTNT
jgi:AAA domain